MKFFTPCLPPTSTAQQKGYNKDSGQFYKKESTQAAIATFHQILAPHRPTTPFKGPVSLTVTIIWPYRKSEPLKNRGRDMWHTVKPDADNWLKQFIDELVTWRFIEDDRCISELICRKYWGENPGIGIEIKELKAELERMSQ